MNGKDYFILGCKLFGVYCLILAVPAILAAIPSFVSLGGTEEYRKILMIRAIAMRLLPVFYVSGGFYLIRGGERLYRFAYPEDPVHVDLIEGKLLLFVKMLGLYLVINYVPLLLQTIMSYIIYTTHPLYNLMQEQQFTYLNAASSVWGVVVGIYLLIGGKFVAKIALKTLSKTPK